MPGQTQFRTTAGWALVFWLAAPLFQVRCAAEQRQQVPILGVCEVLGRLSAYRGQNVVLIASAGWTFEGVFAEERCAPDGRISIQGHRWPSAIEVRRTRTNGEPLPVDGMALQAKFRQLRPDPPPRSPSQAASQEETQDSWIAVYGRVESPASLRLPRTSGKNPIAGNGYGANGSVPARIVVEREQVLIRGKRPSWPAPKTEPEPLNLPEPPTITTMPDPMLPPWLPR